MKQVWKEVKRNKFWLVVTIVGVALSSFVDVLLPRFFSSVVTLIKATAPGGNLAAENSVVAIAIKMFIIVFVAVICGVIGNYGAAHINANLEKNLRSKLFAKVQSFSIKEIDKFSTGSLITRTTNDITQIQNFVGMFVRMSVRALIMMIGGIAMTVTSNVGLALPIALAAPLLLLIVFVVFKKVVPKFKILQKSVDKINLILREQITGVRVVRAFVNEDYEESRFDETNAYNTQLSNKIFGTMTTMQPLFTVILNASVIGIILLAAGQIITAPVGGSGLLEGEILATVQYAMQILFSFIMLSMIFVMYPNAETSAKRIFEVIDTPLSIEDFKLTTKINMTTQPVIEFKRASFTYEGAQKPVLESLDIVIETGKTTAIVGATGSGKSTLLKLMLRLYDVSQGILFFHGRDLREITQKDLRDNIGYAPQVPFLFAGTIAENIRYGKPDANEDEIVAALKAAGAMEFVSKEEGGIYATVAKAGGNFSGGQKQRLSIARAIVGRRELVLFDDSFSALDARTDRKVRRAVGDHLKHSAKVIVAQKISSIVDADSIIVLDKGFVVGRGSHDQLMASCSVYKEIYLSQLAGEEVVQYE